MSLTLVTTGLGAGTKYFGETRGFGMLVSSALEEEHHTGTEGRGPSRDGRRSSLPSGSHFGFVEVTERAGLGSFRHVTGARGDKLEPETMGGGGAFIDLTGNGWLDVVLVGGGTWNTSSETPGRTLWVYENQKDGTFELWSRNRLSVSDPAYGFGLAAADVDRDGDQDLYLTTLGRDRLFESRGGRLVETDVRWGLSGTSQWNSSALFFDANRDGEVDLYVGGYLNWSPETDASCSLAEGVPSYCTPEVYEGIPGLFFLGQEGPKFVERTAEAGLDSTPGKTLGVAELDYDRDGWPDLMLANDMESNSLFHNRGDGTFEERGLEAGVALSSNGNARAGMGIAAGVVDSTGKPTVFIGNFLDEAFGVFRHRNRGLFVERSAGFRLRDLSRDVLTFGLILFDSDLDGDLDLLAANGHVQPAVERTGEGDYRQPPHFYRNTGSERYVLVDPNRGGVLDRELVGRGLAYGDYDRDGDQDVLITENGGPVHLWRNETKDGRSVRLHLEGVASTPDALGSIVEAWNGHSRQVRRVTTGGSYLSQSELTLTFGLGTNRVLDSLRVTWPTGSSIAFERIPAGREYLLREGEEDLRVRYTYSQD